MSASSRSFFDLTGPGIQTAGAPGSGVTSGNAASVSVEREEERKGGFGRRAAARTRSMSSATSILAIVVSITRLV